MERGNHEDPPPRRSPAHRPGSRRCSSQAGSAELLLSDSERLAVAAADAGVDVTLHVADGERHLRHQPERGRGANGGRLGGWMPCTRPAGRPWRSSCRWRACRSS